MTILISDCQSTPFILSFSVTIQLNLILTSKTTTVVMEAILSIYVLRNAMQKKELLTASLKLPPKVTHITFAPLLWPKKVAWPHQTPKRVGKYNPTIFSESKNLEIFGEQHK